jgi:hypothetical protein
VVVLCQLKRWSFKEAVMEKRWVRLAPLLGVAFVVLLVVDFVIGGSEPGPSASAAKVVSWYGAHRGSVRVSDYLMVVVLVLGLFFYGYLRERLAEDASGLAMTAFGGAVLFAVSGAVSSGAQLALADSPGSLSPATAHALNLVDSYVAGIAVAAGAAVLLLAAGLAILRGVQLPAWTGWLALAFGVVTLLPSRGDLGPISAGIWTLIVSIVLLARGSEESVASQPEAAHAMASGAR